MFSTFYHTHFNNAGSPHTFVDFEFIKKATVLYEVLTSRENVNLNAQFQLKK